MKAIYRIKVEINPPKYGTQNWYYKTRKGALDRFVKMMKDRSIFRVSLYYKHWPASYGFVGQCGGITARYHLINIIRVLKDVNLASTFGLYSGEIENAMMWEPKLT